jgi:hypothetical protein
MSWNENLDVFFSGLDKATAVFDIADGETREVTGYFDRAWYDAAVGETVLDTTQPRFTCKQSDLAGISREMAVTINGEAFSVVEIHPEGTGLATVLLAIE